MLVDSSLSCHRGSPGHNSSLSDVCFSGDGTETQLQALILIDLRSTPYSSMNLNSDSARVFGYDREKNFRTSQFEEALETL